MLNSTEQENIVLSCILRKPTLIHRASTILEPSDFSEGRARTIYMCMLSLMRDGKGIDFLSIMERSKELKFPPPTVQELSTLEDFTWTAEAFGPATFTVKEDSVLRKIKILCDHIGSQTKDQKASDVLNDIQRRTTALCMDLDSCSKEDGVLTPTDSAELGLELIHQRMTHPGIQGPQIGFPTIDRAIRGLRPINIVSGGTGVGKTTVALNMAINLGVHNEVPTLYLNYEMDKEELIGRIQANISRVDLDSVETGTYDQKTSERLIMASKCMGNSKLYLSGNEPKTIDHTVNLIHQYHSEYGIKVVFIDYLGEITPDKFKSDNRESDYATFSRWVQTIKDECSTLGIKAVILSQLTRDADDSPKLNQVAGSIDIARKANTFIVLGYDKNLAQTHGLVSNPNFMKIVKNRAGRSPVTVPIVFDGDFQQVREVE
tara:strand:+ start:4068 stop:5363 length:1296 start_codon:yes stop_codon:yes gene_type:complete